jgi:hypothetical protein
MDIISLLDRRSFLKKSGMAIAGLGVYSDLSASGERLNSRPPVARLIQVY